MHTTQGRPGGDREAPGIASSIYYLYPPSADRGHGNRVVEEINGHRDVIASYVYGNYIDEVLQMDRDLDGLPGMEKTFYYLHDDQYNVLSLVDADDGNIAERYVYGAFGAPEILDGSGNPVGGLGSAVGNPYMFNGRRYDAESGLYWYRTRYMDPQLGRFIARDTIGLWGDENNMGNPYAFVGNNPWTHLDPYGESIWRKLASLRKVPGRWTSAQKRAGGLDVWNRVNRSDIVGRNADGIATVGGRKVSLPDGAVPGRTHKHVAPSGKEYDVPITNEGWVDFSKYSKHNLDASDGFVMTGDSTLDIANASELYEMKTGNKIPTGYTWHHHHDAETMQLVPKELNNLVAHTGGDAIVKAGIAKAAPDASWVSKIKAFSVAGGVALGTTLFPNTTQAENLTQGTVSTVVDVLDTLDPGVQDVVSGLWWIGEQANGGEFAVKAPSLSDAHETWFGEGE